MRVHEGVPPISGLTGGTVASFDEGDRPMEPSYAALVKLLPLLHVLVDATGEVHLTEEEVARLRALGFAAHSGKWHVPSLPPELTRDTPFESLSAGWNDRADAPQILRNTGNPERVTASRQVTATPREPKRTPGRNRTMLPQQCGPVEPVVEEVAQKIERALQNQAVPLRRLQQRMWRYSGDSGRIFKLALRYLMDRGKIVLYSD